MTRTTLLFAAALSAGLAAGAFAQGVQSPPATTPSAVPPATATTPSPNAGIGAGAGAAGANAGVGADIHTGAPNAEPALPKAGAPTVGPQALDQACAADVQRYCTGKIGPEMRSCLDTNKSKVSAGCSATLTGPARN